MPEHLPLALIAAVARNGVIGADNALPWRLPSDLRHFKALTMGKPVLMGRKTYESIGGPLPGRFIIVISKTAGGLPDGTLIAAGLDEAIAQGEAIGQAAGIDEIMVAGGGTIYAALIGRARRLYITEVDDAPRGDTRFPAIDPALWCETDRTSPVPGPRDAVGFSFVTYQRA